MLLDTLTLISFFQHNNTQSKTSWKFCIADLISICVEGKRTALIKYNLFPMKKSFLTMSQFHFDLL